MKEIDVGTIVHVRTVQDRPVSRGYTGKVVSIVGVGETQLYGVEFKLDSSTITTYHRLMQLEQVTGE